MQKNSAHFHDQNTEQNKENFSTYNGHLLKKLIANSILNAERLNTFP